MSLNKQQKQLARTAASIHAILTSDPVKLVRVEPPEYWWERVQEDLRLFRRAQDRGWNTVVEAQRLVALTSLRQLLNDVTGKINALDQLAPAQHLALTPRHVYEDLVALEQEFDGKVEWKAQPQKLSVETEPIELEGRYLGAFRIELCLKQLRDSSPYEIIALDPHPAARDDNIVHPHVSGGALCEGDGKTPIRNALRSGRLYDFFLLVNNILHTYNADGPYVSLDAWNGASCSDCDYTIDGDAYTCSQCECTVCSECERCCGRCSNSLCSQCHTNCAVCEESLCSECSHNCRSCSSSCCANCVHQDERCDRCHEDDEEHDTAPSSNSAGAAV